MFPAGYYLRTLSDMDNVDSWIEPTLLSARLCSLTHSFENLSSPSLLREIRSFSYSTRQSLSLKIGFIIQGKFFEWYPNFSVTSKIKMDLLRNRHIQKEPIIFFQVPSSSTSMTDQEYDDDGPARHESVACKFSEQNLQTIWEYSHISWLVIPSSECRPCYWLARKNKRKPDCDFIIH